MGTVAVGNVGNVGVPGAATRARWGERAQFLWLAMQLAVAVLLVWEFQLESRTFFHVALLLAGGFVVHALLPLPARLPFFVALSVAAVVVVFGPANALPLVGVGLALIGLAHLPVAFGVRVALLVGAAVALALFRANVLPGTWLSNGAWAILGSMFMFRLALYVHALRHRRDEDPAPTVGRTLAYFFMAPNLCFPLFPVVDYATFARQYYDRPALEIYQTGMRWIARGLIQLLLYRLVYYRVVANPSTAQDLGDVLRFMLGTYFLYLRVSGTFHVAVGLLGLFGWRLPETHRLYYLASSFNDYWRRINIYWKDFMMKLVYYPSFFRLRRVGQTTALVGATAAVFATTWVLHSYQWFWLRGGWPITAPDTLFWGILGGLVIWNALRESRRGRRRVVGRQPAWSWSLAWRTLGTFTAICVLWSLWSAESVGDWLFLLAAARTVGPQDLLALGLFLAVGLAIAGRSWDARPLAPTGPRPWYAHPSTTTTAVMLAALTLAPPAARGDFGPRAASIVGTLRSTTLNARDEAVQNKGYYEKLDTPGRLETAQWAPEAQAPPGWDLPTVEYQDEADELPIRRLLPNVAAVQVGRPVTINRWGMRDRDFERAKPPGVYRVAILGASQVFGFGVGDQETFAKRLEDRLNGGAPAGRRVEVLNFGVRRSSLLDRLVHAEDVVLGFQPDLVILVVNWREPPWLRRDLSVLTKRGADLRYRELRTILARHGALDAGRTGPPVPLASMRAALRHGGLEARMPEFERLIRLRDASGEVVPWVLERLASQVRAGGAVPLVVGLDIVSDLPPTYPEVLAASRQASMEVVDLFGMFRGRDLASLRITPWDHHPNAAGHQLIADRLYDELEQRRTALGIPRPIDAVASVAP